MKILKIHMIIMMLKKPINEGIRSVSSPWYLSTDKCNYHPGEQVTVHFSGDMPSGARIRIYSGSEVPVFDTHSTL